MTEPIVLVVRSAGQGDYSVALNGTVLFSCRRALTAALSSLRMEGLSGDALIVVRNADNGAQSEPFALSRYSEVCREGILPLPETRRGRIRKSRVVRPVVEAEAVRSVAEKPANLPPIRGRSAVWVDQRARTGTYPDAR